MDQEIPLRVLEEFSIPSPSSETGSIMQNGSVDMAPTPSVSSSSSSSLLRKTFNGLPRELRDYIYEFVYDEDLYVVLGRRGILPVGSEGPSHPDSTSQITSRHRVIYPGSHPSFGAKIVDSHVDPDSEPEQAEMTAYGAAVRKSLRAYGDPASSNKVNDEPAALETTTRKNWLSSIPLASCCGAAIRPTSAARTSAGSSIPSTTSSPRTSTGSRPPPCARTCSQRWTGASCSSSGASSSAATRMPSP